MIQISNVVAKYPGGEGLESVNLTLEPGEFVYLVGPSGAGKSSVLKVIYLDIFPQSGHVIVNGYSSLTIKKSVFHIFVANWESSFKILSCCLIGMFLIMSLLHYR